MDSCSQAEELIRLLLQCAHQSFLENTEQMAHGEDALLSYLALRHDGATAGELRDALAVGSSRVANTLKQLESKGMIVRSPSDEDGRVVLVHLTPAGREIILARLQHLSDQVCGLLEELGAEDSEALVRIARKLVCLHPAEAPDHDDPLPH